MTDEIVLKQRIGFYEKVPTTIYSAAAIASKAAAKEIATLIKTKQLEGNKTVLELATGSTVSIFIQNLFACIRKKGLVLRILFVLTWMSIILYNRVPYKVTGGLCR